MPDKTVRFVIDAEVWKEFRIQALQNDLTASAALVNLITAAVREGGASGKDTRRPRHRGSGSARDAA